MRIRTQFIITTIIFALVLMGVSLSALITNIRVGRTNGQQAIASRIAQGANELSYLANDYVIYQEIQQLERWQNRFDSFSKDVAGLDVSTPEQTALVLNIQANTTRLQEVFTSVASSVESPSGNQSGLIDSSLLRVSWSRISVQSQSLVSDSTRLAQLLDNKANQLQRENILAISILIGVLIAFFLVNFFTLQRRLLKGMTSLQVGAALIGSGNLDFRIEERRYDEIGDLSRAFNRMTADLKTVTASKTELEKEIEERKKAEEALKESEAKANALIKYAPTGIYEIDFRTGKFISVNESMSSLTGYTRDELFALGPAALLDDESKKRFGDRAKRQLAGEQLADTVEYRVRKKDGSILFVDLNVSFSKVNPGAVFVIGHDVTERKLAEEALKQSEEKFRSLNVNMNEGICLHELIYDETGKPVDYRILDINPAYETFTGITKEQAIGKKASELYGTGQPPYFDIYERVTATGKPESFETYFPPMQKYFSISTFSPGKGQFATVFTDITERKLTETKLEEQAAMLANVNDAVIGYDAGYRVTYWNRAAEEIYGYSAAEVMGKVSNILLKPTYSGITREELVSRITRDGHMEAESGRTTKDGREIYVDTHVIGLKDENHILTGYVAVDRDITERKKTERQILESELRYRRLFESAKDGILIIDADTGRVFDINPFLLNLLGYSSEELLGRKLWEIGLFKDITSSREAFQVLLNKGYIRYEDLPLEAKNGQRIEVEFVSNVYRIDDTKVIQCNIRDITERKKIENALRESEQRFRVITSSTPDHIIMQDSDLRYTLVVNPQLGLKEKDMVGKTDYDFLAKEDADELTKAKRQVIETGKPVPLETSLTNAKGELEYFAGSYVPTFNNEGKADGLIGYFQNITDHKKAEKEIAHLASFPELNPNPIIEIDTSGNVRYANPAARNLFPDILKQGSKHPFLAGFSEVSDEMVSITRDVKLGDLWYDQTLTYVPATQSYRIYARDITERKKAEEALRETRNYLDNLFNYANAPIIVWNPRFEITSFNHAFERLTGKAASEVLGRPLEILFLEDSRDETMQHIFEATSGERWEVEEIPIRHTDGTVRILLWNSANIHDPVTKEVIATIAQGQDITERRQAEESLKRQTAELEASNRELEAFSYSVSHDLRAPLRSMEGFSNALLEDYSEKLDDQGKQYLKYVQESSNLMARLIDDLLKLSRVTRAEMEYEAVDLSRLAGEILDSLETNDPGHKTELHIARDMTVSGDAGLLRLALENLLGNAWKFSSKQDFIKIEMGVMEYKGKKAYFVRDNGVGFDMQYSNKLFQPFQRLHRAVDFAGTGIGLATVQRIIRRHGGDVWAESKVGEGATFYFTLGA